MKWFRARRPIQIFCFTLVGLMLFGMYLVRTSPVYAHHPGTDQSGTCTPSDSHIHGQNHGGVIGTEGEEVTDLGEALNIDLTAEPDLVVSSPSDLEARPDAILIPATQIPSKPGIAPVAILVVDDFQNSIIDSVPHGSMVMEILQHTLDSLDSAGIDVSGIRVYPIDVGLADPSGPPESHYRTDTIAPQIADKVTTLQEQEGIYRFVINMSFGMMPCHMGIDMSSGTPTLVPITLNNGELDIADNVLYFDFFNYLDQHNRISVLSIPEYIQYLNDNRGIINPTIPDTFEATLNGQPTPIGDLAFSKLLIAGSGTPGEGASFNVPSNTFAKPLSRQTSALDPLRVLLQGYVQDTANTLNEPSETGLIVIPVASAGNFGGINDIIGDVTPQAPIPGVVAAKPPPLEPASWPEVIAVSASVGDGTRLWASSNAGELMALGGWYKFNSGNYNVGTSFSAPVESSLIALYLSNHSTIQCAANSSAPPFAYPTDNGNHSFEDALTNDCVHP